MKTIKLIKNLTSRRAKKQVKAALEIEDLLLKGELELDEETVITAIPVLIRSLDNEDDHVVNAVLSLLEAIAGSYPETLTGVIPELVGHVDKSARTHRMVLKSIKGVALFNPDAVFNYVPLLISHLTDRNAEIVEMASSAIFQISKHKPDDVSNLLIKHLDTPNEMLNTRIINIFKKIYDSHPEYTQQLSAILNYYIANKKHEQVLLTAGILSNGITVQPSVMWTFLPQLIAYLKSFGGFWNEEGSLIIDMILKIGTENQPDSIKNAVSYLLKNIQPICTGSNPYFYAKGMIENAVVENPDYIQFIAPFLIRWLNSSDTTQKMYASAIITGVAPLRPHLLRDTIGPLIQCLESTEQAVRYNAIVAIDTIGAVKPMYVKSAFDKLSALGRHDPDMHVKKTANDTLSHLSVTSEIDDALIEEYRKLVRKHTEVTAKIDKLKIDLQNGAISNVDYSYWINVSGEDMAAIENAIEKSIEKQIRIYGYIREDDTVVNESICISDMKEQMDVLKAEWLNERMSLEDYELRLDFIRVILLYLVAQRGCGTYDDIEFLESSTPSTALMIHSLQDQLDERKHEMIGSKYTKELE